MRGKAWLAQKTIDAAVSETNEPGTRLPAGGFRVPGLPVVAVLGLLTCGFLMIAILSPLTLCLIGDVLVSIGVYALVRSRFVPGYDAQPSCLGPRTSRWRWPGDDYRTTEELLGHKPVPPVGTIAALLGPDEDDPPEGGGRLPRTATDPVPGGHRPRFLHGPSELIADEEQDVRKNLFGG